MSVHFDLTSIRTISSGSVLHVQGQVCGASLLLRDAVPTLRGLELEETEPNLRLVWKARASHRRAHQSRLSNCAQAAARWLPGGSHYAVPARRLVPIQRRSRLQRLGRSAQIGSFCGHLISS
jgi:hypothetical protein